MSDDAPLYQRKSRLTVRQRNRLVEHFVAGTTARAAAELVGVNRNTAVSFYNRLRMIIARELTKASPISGEIVWESSGEGTMAGEDVRDVLIPVWVITQRLWSNILTDFWLRESRNEDDTDQEEAF